MKHLRAVDGLRAVAVLAVVAYHAGLPVPAGFVGVDVFFVISGYLITRLLRDEVQATGRIDFMAFYARRARRILPALVVVVLATLGASVLLLPDVHDVALSASAAGAFVANVFFQAKTGGYWSASAETMPLLHLWSLSVEEQFYLVWPVVLILARKRPAVALGVLAALSFAAAESLQSQAAFYQMPARAWELALGGLVALRPVAVPKGAGWAGLAVVLLACFVPIAHFPGVGALPAVAGAALLVAAIQNGERIPALEFRPMVAVGLISYSLYLWHWPLLALYQATHVGTPPLAVRLALVAAAFVLAALSYRCVEVPCRRVQGRRRVVGVGLAGLVALSGGAFASAPPAKPKPVDPSPISCQEGRLFRWPECVKHTNKVVLWGDSYALGWRPLAEQLAAERGIPATWLFLADCSVTVGETIPRTTSDPRACRKHNDEVLRYVQTTPTDTVVVATNLIRLFRENPEQGRAGLENLVAAVQPHVRRIVFVAPTPFLRDEVETCQAAHDPCMVTAAEYRKQAGDVRAELAKLARMDKVEIIDPSAWYLAGDWSNYGNIDHVTRESVVRFLQAGGGGVVHARAAVPQSRALR